MKDFTKLMMQEDGSNRWQSQNKNLLQLTLEEEKMNKDGILSGMRVIQSSCLVSISHSEAAIPSSSPNEG